jgi:hypothetical protein
MMLNFMYHKTDAAPPVILKTEKIDRLGEYLKCYDSSLIIGGRTSAHKRKASIFGGLF